MVTSLTLALTGATGFVGQRTLEKAVAAGDTVRALTRSPQPAREGVTWVAGSLDDPEALGALCDGADAVLHIAGVINAPDAAGFEAGNVTGTATMLAAAKQAGIDRFVHVSSLAAREPQLSLYGASKARSETLVRTSGLDAVIVRPPAVYGPGDKETLELFKMAKLGVVALPPKGRLSVIHVDDLADLLLALITLREPFDILEPDDGAPDGYSHEEFASLLGKAFGRKVLSVSMPSALIRAGAAIDGLVRGKKAKLTADRADYFCHPDWVVATDRRPPPELWRPRIATEPGLAETARWYEREGWL